MRRYIEHIQAKPPHQRREHAVQGAVAVTAVVFALWVGTLGFRFMGAGGAVAQQTDASNTGAGQTQLAGVAAGADQTAAHQTAVDPSVNSLQVSTTSILTQ